jgi:predicted LPLAT superfamily acyltransferase
MENKNRRIFGNAWMHRTLIKLLRRVDIRYVYRFTAVCVIPVAMVVSPGARIAYRYFRKRRGQGRWQALLSTYRNHCLFGQTVIDKFAMYAGHRFEIHSTGHEFFYAHVRDDQPVMLLNAHIGSSEMVGYNLSQSKPCNVLVYGGEKEELMEYRKKQFADMGIKMIPVGEDGVNIIEIMDCLDRGEALSVFADRFMNPRKVIRSTIHGFKVRLSRGPFAIAVNRGIDVYMVVAMKQQDGSYDGRIIYLDYDKTLPHREQCQQLADLYTAEIEKILEEYPLQWFNYFNIWEDE